MSCCCDKDESKEWTLIDEEPEDHCLLLFYSPKSVDSYIIGLSDAFEDILEEDPSITHWKVISRPPSPKEMW